MKESPFNGIYLQPRHKGKWVAWNVKTKKVVSYSVDLMALSKRIRHLKGKNIVYLIG